MNIYSILAETDVASSFQMWVGVVATFVSGSFFMLGGYLVGKRIWPDETAEEAADRRRRENDAAVMDLLNQSRN